MEHDHGEVTDPESEPLPLIRLGDGESDHKECTHASQEQEPMADVVGGDGVRQPRVAVVHPPDHGEHHHDLR